MTADAFSEFDENQRIELIEFTDPYCTWCWGSEPVLRKITEVYGDQVKIDFVMGGLVKDISQFYDPVNKIGGHDWNKQVARHWLEASERHGMPVDERGFPRIAGDFTSTYPANIAVKAAAFQGRDKAARFLRRLREAAAAEARQIHREEVQAELAREVGLEVDRFRQDLRGSKAENAFNEDLKVCREHGVTGFPTFLISSTEGQRRMMRGYHPFEDFTNVLPELSPGIKGVKPKFDAENVQAFVRKHGKVATAEVATVFDLPRGQAIEVLEKLREEQNVYRVEAGNDFFWILDKRIQDKV